LGDVTVRHTVSHYGVIFEAILVVGPWALGVLTEGEGFYAWSLNIAYVACC